MQIMTDAEWSHFPHVADIGVRGTGPTLEAAFEQAARALFAVVTDLAEIKPLSLVTVVCDAPNAPMLLVDWLNALIYQASMRDMLFSRFSVRIEADELLGEAWGERIDLARHHPAVEPKGATFTELRVGQLREGGWIAQCVVDV
jgi:SHS2 domain-containing protein